MNVYIAHTANNLLSKHYIDTADSQEGQIDETADLSVFMVPLHPGKPGEL